MHLRLLLLLLRPQPGRGSLFRQVDSDIALLPGTYLFNLYKAGGRPSLAELLQALAAILKVFDKIYVLFDAIDKSLPRGDLPKYFSTFPA